MSKEKENIEYIGTISFISCEVKDANNIPQHTYISIDIYRTTKRNVTLTITDLTEKEDILTMTLDSELSVKLAKLLRKAVRSE